MNPATVVPPRNRQSQLGQFLTPEPLAAFMASLFEPLPQTIRLLDAGAGAGALTQAFVARLCERNQQGVQSIDAALYEMDLTILNSLSLAMRDCQRRCSRAGIRFTSTIYPIDFIQEMSSRLVGDLFGAKPPKFDAAIVNPPYRKIGIDSSERRALSSIGIETSNLYAGFISVIQRLLVPGGQLVGITPRSFCNGPYFRPFREEFLGNLGLRRLHVFESRQAAFYHDGVLQENIVFHAVKSRTQPGEIVISSSSGEPGGEVTEAILPFAEVVHPRDKQRFIHIPSSASHNVAKHSLKGLNTDLASLGVTVSTGRVVDFRLKDALRMNPERGAVPLIYPCHFQGGTVHWPKSESRKPNAIVENANTRPWLVPSGVYLLTKRFTSKEERRRIVACLFEPSQAQADWIGFENHLNYFHANGRALDRHLAYGLYAFLNSTVVDQYFRRFSGHTQVNATDLRTLMYPTRKTLQNLGRELVKLNLSQEEIDLIVNNHLHVSR